MLTIINSYSHGYVAVPVILAAKKHGLFTLLHGERSLSFAEIVQALRANSGHLRVALRMLESLDWVRRTSDDAYALTPKADMHRNIPEDMMQLLSFPMGQYTGADPTTHSLQRWIESSARRWDVDDQLIARFLDGMLMIPLLLAVKERGLFVRDDKQTALLLRDLNPVAREEVSRLFISQGWLQRDAENAVLSDAGRFMAERIFITATVASYRPMLMNISTVLFGDCESVFQRTGADHESHVDRSLNVLGSGFQHETYFSDMEESILCLFDTTSYEQQPKYIADMGCGDGTLLKKIHEIIRTKTRRGGVLDAYPLTMIAIDYNAKALERASSTLKGIDHLVIQGDIGDPERLIVDLEKRGIHERDAILHVRSFLDHDRPYIPPVDAMAEKALSAIPCESASVERSGNEIAGHAVLQSLIEHLQRWSAVMSRYGMLIFEVHCLQSKTVRTYLDKTESLHFDAYHGFSQQLLVSADNFVMAAAAAGLFPRKALLRKYPKTLPFARITLNHFEKKEFQVRYAHERDAPFLEELEQQCWEPELQTPAHVLMERLRRYPEGQLVLQLDGRVVGAVYTQRIDNPQDLRQSSRDTVEDLHRPDGPILQLLGITILPAMQHRNLGGQLLEFVLIRSRFMDEVRSVMGISRCGDYQRHADIPLQEYIGHRNEQGRLVDPILRFHEMHGAHLHGLVHNYRPEDRKNNGCGVLIEYPLDARGRGQDDYRSAQPRTGDAAAPAFSDTDRSIREFVEKIVVRILGNIKEAGFSWERPLMEMGLNSADLLELNEQIARKYHLALEPAFFFEHNTCSRIASYVRKHIGPEAAGGDVPSQDGVGMQSDRASRRASREAVRPKHDQSGNVNDIAIIGAACRLPGGITTMEKLWELLASGRDAIRKMPSRRWSWPDTIDPEREHAGIDLGGFLDDIESFDASFFRISPKEAELMDPQQRIALELSWECLEHGGYSAEELSGSNTGVFIGASGSDYAKLLDRHLDEIDASYGIGTSAAALPNRISYFLDFHGPSVQIDTACSSSLVALHAAVRSLQCGECDQALVGGINIICHPANTIAYYKAGMLARDGRCKTFDRNANGYVRGEGAVLVLLKPLETALADQDSIYAVIKGTAINHGGQAGGLTVPNPAKQAALLRDVYAKSGIMPETVGYIETHGTGTSLGDPIEISGLKEAFAEPGSAPQEVQAPYCGLGSIKTNIGHLEAAAGLAGLLKVVLSMRHHELPASLHFTELNPHIALSPSPFYIVQKKQPWNTPPGRLLRRAGVSSFGSGGTNAHVVLEEAPGLEHHPEFNLPGCLICLSAKTGEALRQRERDFALWLEQEGRHHSLHDISAALLLGRVHFGIRAAYVVSDVPDLQEKLKEVMSKGHAARCYRATDPAQPRQAQPLLEQFGQTILKELGSGMMFREEDYLNRLAALAELYVQGHQLDWKALYADTPRRRISMPGYPFARQRYWVSPSTITFPHGDRKTTYSPTQDVPAPAHDEKPNGILLRSLTTDGMPASTPVVNDQRPVIDELSNRSSPLHGSTTGPQQATAVSLQEDLAASLAEALYMKRSDVDINKKFVDMGLDSIIGVEWIRAINKQYGTSIQTTRVYDYPSIGEFAAYLEKELSGKGRGPERASGQEASSLSLDEVLQKVQQGTLDVEQAAQLLH